jgi:predicted MFS family arabinose efflux permease
MLDNRWAALASIFVTRLALGFQFQSAGSIAPFLVHDFHIDFVQVGSFVGAYLFPGAFIAIPSGFLSRRFGDKRIVSWGIVLLILGGVISGAAPTFWFLMSGRVLSGIGASLVLVLATKMVTDWFAGKELVLAMSINIIGWPMGIAIGQATQASLAQLYSWHSVFFLTSAVLMVTLVAMILLYRDPSGVSRSPQSISGLSAYELWMVCLTGAVWMLVNASYLVILTFGPTLLAERGISVIEANFTVSLMSWVSMVALPVGAYLSTRYRMPNLSMFLGLLGSIVTAVLLPIAPGAQIVLLVLFGVAFSFAMPVISTLPAQSLAEQNRALGFGIYFVWFYAGTPILTAGGGWLKDKFGTAQFSFFYAAALIAISLMLILIVRYQQTLASRQNDLDEKTRPT